MDDDPQPGENPAPKTPAPDDLSGAPKELEQDLEPQGDPPVPPLAHPAHAKPQSSGLQAGVLKELQTLIALMQGNMDQQERRIARLVELHEQGDKTRREQSEQLGALMEMLEDHLASWEDGMERHEGIMAAHVRLLQEQAHQRTQQPQQE
jgi:hypothetical protein